MCNECCKELSGWCRAFTRVERALVILEAVLLVLFLGLLVFVTLHIIVCSTPITYNIDNTTTSTTQTTDQTNTDTTHTNNDRTTTNYNNHNAGSNKIECSWTPSAQTRAVTHYYDTDRDIIQSTSTKVVDTKPSSALDEYDFDKELLLEKEFIESEYVSDGEEVNDERKSFVIALVKMKPPTDITFGCILTIISEYWVLTTASCIEAIEELESLDSFVMMEEYGSDKNGQIHTVTDLQVHPFYQVTNKTYDIAALRSENSLLQGDKRPVNTISAIDDALMTIGERFHLLGYGAFRGIESGAGGRSVRAAHVYSVAARLCAGAGVGALRHLSAGRRAPALRLAPPPRRALCAGVLTRAGRARPCNFCGGAPLLTGAADGRWRLLALMTEAPQCGVACDPHLYLPVLLVQDWIERLLSQ